MKYPGSSEFFSQQNPLIPIPDRKQTAKAVCLFWVSVLILHLYCITKDRVCKGNAKYRRNASDGFDSDRKMAKSGENGSKKHAEIKKQRVFSVLVGKWGWWFYIKSVIFLRV